ncbi:hypothetical protein [Gaopeijia maritima]|uniref:Uncharacterized protein n=1 Tax=Gaopeijia maritima TaxID=3119007 RepID=A0ABU9EAK2_9BACT
MTGAASGPSYRVRTAPDASDARMRGRRYAIPFDRVWSAAFRLLSGGLPHWSLTWEDDEHGVLEAKVPHRTLRPAGLVRVRVYLDADAQTCVEMFAGPADGGRDLGASRRRVLRFFEALDRDLAPGPGQRLTPIPTAR